MGRKPRPQRPAVLRAQRVLRARRNPTRQPPPAASAAGPPAQALPDGAPHDLAGEVRRPVRDQAEPVEGRREPVTAQRDFVRDANAPVIELHDVRKTYRIGDIAVHALRGVTLRVQRGEYVAIVGASGSGKTTLMNILGCLDQATSGVYRLNGLDVSGIDEDTLADVRNRQIGFVFQSFNLLPRTRALANVELPLAYAGLPRGARAHRAMAALALVGLARRGHHLPSELSGGQQQRVAIARALVTNPAMILADEPTGALDTVSSAEVMGIFGRLSAQGRTIVLITHEMDVAAHARRLIRVSDGQIVADETPDGERLAQ